jgi:ribonuclease HII
MEKSIEHMKIPPEYSLVDGNSFTHTTLKYKNIIGGDAISFTIAAASIIAKVTRDRLMCELDIHYPQYGFARHKGYGTRQHIEAIRRYGFCEIHRKSFHLSALQK